MKASTFCIVVVWVLIATQALTGKVFDSVITMVAAACICLAIERLRKEADDE